MTRLRFRIVEITTFAVTLNSGLADLRALTSANEAAVPTSNGPVAVSGTTVEQPPTQIFGGAWNSSLNVPDVSGFEPLAAVGKIKFESTGKGKRITNAGKILSSMGRQST